MATLYRKYRPQIFDEVQGQDHVVETLKQAMETDKIAHAYLFCGPRGVGKTTVARILAKAVNCLEKTDRPCGKCRNCIDISQGRFIDLIEIDAASNRGIEEIRDLRDKIKFAPSIGKKKVYIIDEVHMLTREAVNALLKTLEEPPEHSIFIFATTEAHKLLDTIVSRCQRFDFHLGNSELVEASIKRLAKLEKLKISDDIVTLIAKASGGSYRDAHSLLGQVAPSLSKGELTREKALKLLNLTSLEKVLAFEEILHLGDGSKAILFLEDLTQQGTNYEEFLNQLIFQIRESLIEKVKSKQPTDWYERVLNRLIEAVAASKYSPIDSLPLELAAIDICQGNVDPVPQKSEVQPRQEKTVEAPLDKPGDTPVTEPAIEPKKMKDIVANFSSNKKLAIIEGVSAKNKPLGTLLGTSQWHAEDNSLKIMVEYPIYKEKIMSENCVALLEGEIEKVLGGKLRVVCVVDKGKEVDEEIGEIFELD